MNARRVGRAFERASIVVVLIDLSTKARYAALQKATISTDGVTIDQVLIAIEG
jgi:hypothetical protein